MTLVALPPLAVLVLVVLGVAYAVTGSVIGYWVRACGWLALHRVGLHRLVTCPSCNAWWGGLVLAGLAGWPWFHALQAAFAACGVAAVVEAQWHLAAGEDFDALFGGAQQKEEGK